MGASLTNPVRQPFQEIETTMASNPNNCNNCGCTPNPLDSGNWESESTVGRSTATTPPADGSLSLSPGPECKVGFTDSYVTKKWHDVTYDAKANLHPDTNCKKEDIVFSLEGETRGSTIDPGSGVVTFGPVGVILTVVVTCGEVFDKMTLLVLRVRIERQNPDDPIPGLWHDITGQKINVKVGNHIIMQAVIEGTS